MPSLRSRSTDAGDLDGIDFKPFFDMVVGVLFVLLILISAQMFFTQWGSAGDPTKPDPAQVALAWEEEQRRFLGDLAERLRSAGFAVTRDDIGRTVSVPLTSLVSVRPDGQPSVQPSVSGASAVLSGRLACLRGEAKGSECSPFKYLALGELTSVARLRSAPTETGIAADRYAYLLSTVLLGALFQTAPDLLVHSGPVGAPTIRGDSSVLGSGTGPDLAGDLAFRFTFRRPRELMANHVPPSHQRP
jgi:hypothetical protein